jgi:soluble P-type ATPase
MGSSTRSMIEMSFATAVFLAAVILGLLLFQTGFTTMGLTYASNQTVDRNVHPALSAIAGNGQVKGAEVLQTMAKLQEMGIDMVVDGIRYSAQLELENTDVSDIRVNDNYTPTYKRGTSGELQQIIFTSG